MHSNLSGIWTGVAEEIYDIRTITHTKLHMYLAQQIWQHDTKMFEQLGDVMNAHKCRRRKGSINISTVLRYCRRVPALLQDPTPA